MKARRLQWPSLPPRLTADLLAGHSAVALALGALIYLVCLTGTLCVFIDELQLWEQPTPAPAAFDPADSDRLVRDALVLNGDPKPGVVFLRAPVTPRERAVVSVGRRQWTPGSDGRLIPLNLSWTDFLAELHYTLTMPAPWGEAVVGLLGMALLSLLVSGVLAHPRILRDAFRLRLGGGRRLQEADLHNRLGVWGLPFHLAVTWTGALFGLASLLAFVVAAFGFHGDTGRAAENLGGPGDAVADPRAAPPPPLSRIVAEAGATHPGSKLYYLSVTAPGTKGARVRVEITAPGRLPRGDDFLFDSEGRRIDERRYATGDFGLQLYSGAAQVHFGAFGGLPVRLAYGVLGLGLSWICAGGTGIWLARRRDRGRPAPRLEQAWSACVWGVPLALAIATTPTPFGPTAAFWLALLAALTLSQTPLTRGRSRAFVARAYRLALAGLLFVLALLRLRAALQSDVALAVEATAATAAASLALWGACGFRSRGVGGTALAATADGRRRRPTGPAR